MPVCVADRYYNFCGRGYIPASQDTRSWIVGKTRALFREDADAAATVTKVFFNRKVRARFAWKAALPRPVQAPNSVVVPQVFKTDIATSLKKERAFRAAMIKELTEAAITDDNVERGDARRQACQWYADNVVPLYDAVKKDSIPGVQAAVSEAANKALAAASVA